MIVNEYRYEVDLSAIAEEHARRIAQTHDAEVLRKLEEEFGFVRRDDYDRLKAENAKLRELCKELLDLCYDAYNQEWGWDDDWALAYERAKKLGVDA